MIPKFGSSPIAPPSIRKNLLPIEWKVPPQNIRGSQPVSDSIRLSIWFAALFVKVSKRISRGLMPHSEISHATRYVSVRVLPDPAPASTRAGLSGGETTAAYWSELSSF